MVRKSIATVGACVVLLIAVACGGSGDGAAPDSPPSAVEAVTTAAVPPSPEAAPEPPVAAPPEIEPQADAQEWLENFNRALEPIIADAQVSSSAIQECIGRAASESADFSECRVLVPEFRADLVELQVTLDESPPPPVAAAFMYDAFDGFLSEAFEGVELLLESFDAAPGSAASLGLFDQFDVRMRRGAASYSLPHTAPSSWQASRYLTAPERH